MRLFPFLLASLSTPITAFAFNFAFQNEHLHILPRSPYIGWLQTPEPHPPSLYRRDLHPLPLHRRNLPLTPLSFPLPSLHPRAPVHDRHSHLATKRKGNPGNSPLVRSQASNAYVAHCPPTAPHVCRDVSQGGSAYCARGGTKYKLVVGAQGGLSDGGCLAGGCRCVRKEKLGKGGEGGSSEGSESGNEGGSESGSEGSEKGSLESSGSGSESKKGEGEMGNSEHGGRGKEQHGKDEMEYKMGKTPSAIKFANFAFGGKRQ